MRCVPVIASMIALGAACATGARNPDLVIDIGSSIMARGTGLTITFKEVTGDSRCPIDVTCVQAGNAQALLEVKGEDGSQQVVGLNTTEGPSEGLVGKVLIRLVRLDPQPVSSVPASARKYSVVLHVTAQ
jgi:hypothetical protein